MRQKSTLVRKLEDTIDNYIEVLSFISSNSEITIVNNKLKSLTAHSQKLLLTFAGINDKLYNISIFSTAKRTIRDTQSALSLANKEYTHSMAGKWLCKE